MSNDPYQIGDIEYWKEGNITRFDPNSLAFKKKVYGNYNRTTIMSDKDSQKAGIQFKLNPDDTIISKNDALREKNNLDSFEGYYNGQFGKSGTWSERNNRQQKAIAYRRLEDINNRIIIIDSILSNPVNIQRWENEAYQKKQIELQNKDMSNKEKMTGKVQNIGNSVDRWYKAEHYDEYPISKYTTYSNPSYLHNLKTSNEWYDWVLAKVRRDSIGTGGKGNDYGENSSYYSSWRMAHLFQNEGSGSAIEYLKELDMTLDARPIPRHNQGSTKESEAFNTMKKMLLLWESKRRIEIPIEEAQRVIQEDEDERLLQIQLENQRIVVEKQKPIIEPKIIPAVVATSALIPLAVIGLLLYSRKRKK